jgi:electron transport complex protein RnfC
MRSLTFKKGIYPPHYKDTARHETEVLLPEKDDVLIYPMLQHIGSSCSPLVEVGEKVLVGQKIGDTESFLSAPIHSSVSGVVEKIDPVLMPNGVTSNAVYIYNDGLMDEHPEINRPYDYKNMSRDEILNVIHQSGIVGMGGAGFPTHVKLKPPANKQIDTIIINAAECEPYLTTDHRVLIEETDRILMGFMVILSLFPRAKGVVGVETNKMDGILALEAACKRPPYRNLISVARLKPKYPQGAEKQLIYSITKKEVPSGGLPADIGCLVHNVDTVISIHRAIFRGRPIMRKIVTITGGAIKNPGNYKVRLGMTYEDVINRIGGFKEHPYKMIAGGPMMGNAMFTLNVPMTKLSQAFLAFTEAEAHMPKERKCIRCGKCSDICPVNLMPFELNQYAVHSKLVEFRANNGMDCIECGSCSFVCPSKRHLAQSIRAERRMVLADKK